eukprot:TRINITY_DN45436_c0_g1_i1.p1 TRINITY_DN45436_c0_g1~~TRINITY_DN45436_c0_g1_i1.p1  ORF type:complete len:511 (+),score=44.80 TRINITY_DN45436_c0_g1_i1:56-1534(+)
MVPEVSGNEVQNPLSRPLLAPIVQPEEQTAARVDSTETETAPQAPQALPAPTSAVEQAVDADAEHNIALEQLRRNIDRALEDGSTNPRALETVGRYSFILLISCVAASVLICSEAVTGIRKSVWCSIGKARAPLVCAVTMDSACIMCFMAVLAGLACVVRFAWNSRNAGFGGVLITVEQQRSALISNLKVWRGWSAKVLLLAGLTYILVGASCAGVAQHAFGALATGFLSLFAAVLFFNDDMHEFTSARLHSSPRLIRFLGVYLLVGITITVFTFGAVEWSYGSVRGKWWADTMSWMPPKEQGPPLDEACTPEGRLLLSPLSCTAPLGTVTGFSLWWVASPVFGFLLSDRGGSYCSCRRILQRHRSHVDAVVLISTIATYLVLRRPCGQKAPVAFFNAGFGIVLVAVSAICRKVHPLCDCWRGPTEHLTAPVTRNFTSTQCPVCLEDLKQGEDVCRTQCNHDFHRDCLEDWVLLRRQRSPNCPLCREVLVAH